VKADTAICNQKNFTGFKSAKHREETFSIVWYELLLCWKPQEHDWLWVLRKLFFWPVPWLSLQWRTA